MHPFHRLCVRLPREVSKCSAVLCCCVHMQTAPTRSLAHRTAKHHNNNTQLRALTRNPSAQSWTTTAWRICSTSASLLRAYLCTCTRSSLGPAACKRKADTTNNDCRASSSTFWCARSLAPAATHTLVRYNSPSGTKQGTCKSTTLLSTRSRCVPDSR